MQNTYSVTVTRTVVSHAGITVLADSFEDALKKAQVEIDYVDFSVEQQHFDDSVTGIKVVSKNVIY